LCPLSLINGAKRRRGPTFPLPYQSAPVGEERWGRAPVGFSFPLLPFLFLSEEVDAGWQGPLAIDQHVGFCVFFFFFFFFFSPFSSFLSSIILTLMISRARFGQVMLNKVLFPSSFFSPFFFSPSPLFPWAVRVIKGSRDGCGRVVSRVFLLFFPPFSPLFPPGAACSISSKVLGTVGFGPFLSPLLFPRGRNRRIKRSLAPQFLSLLSEEWVKPVAHLLSPLFLFFPPSPFLGPPGVWDSAPVSRGGAKLPRPARGRSFFSPLLFSFFFLFFALRD